jgi:ABC-2 type transport system ATP-binding protein
MEEADRLCQRLAIVDHGRILTLDTPAPLRKGLPGGQILDMWVRAERPLAPDLEGCPASCASREIESHGDSEGLERLRLFVDPRDGPARSRAACRSRRRRRPRHLSLNAPSLRTSTST